MNSHFYKNLFFTYLLSKADHKKGAVILLDGLPSSPSSKDQLMQKLAERGYDVFFPRYEGTLEAKGEFLKRSPSQALIEFIEKLKKGFLIENKRYKAKKVFVLGASFGGGVALDIASKQVVDKICVTSPVVSFRKVVGIETLENYLKTVRPEDYRFDSKNWQKLLKDRIWNLDNNKIEKPEDVLIIAGRADDQIKEGDLVEFGKRNNIETRLFDSGHITLSKITEPMLEEIFGFF